jgi:hypothetical protein
MRNGARYHAVKIQFGSWENKSIRIMWGKDLQDSMDLLIKDIESIELDE